MRPSSKFTLALALVVAGATPALASWPNQSAVNLPVCTAASDQIGTTAVADGAGGAIIAWYDARIGVYDIYAQHVLASGVVDAAWPVNGRALCTASSQQYAPVIVSDGAGGAIVAWNDYRSGVGSDIYAQHVLASGAVDPAWPVNGRALCTAVFDQNSQAIVSDGAGGAVVAWNDLRNAANADVYAQHVLASGAVDPAWPVDGRALCSAAGDQANVKIISDGAGGAIATWADIRGGVAFDVYAQHVLSSGAVDAVWPVDGRAVCTAANHQYGPVIVGDGAGGGIIAWIDQRAGANDIFAQHVMPSGAVDFSWPADGRAVCAAANSQSSPVIATDGAGGAVVSWFDFRSGVSQDIYAQHMLASGTVDAAWPVDGRALCTAASEQSFPTIIPDGAGGAIITWMDFRGGTYSDVYAQHVLASGAVDGAWPSDGHAICTAANHQTYPVLVSDGAGGAIVAWYDYRPTGTSDIYAQRVAKYGYLGTPEAEMAGVKDVPVDNGGKVRVSWTASYLEFDPWLAYTYYYLFRSVPTHVAAQALARESRLRSATDPALRPGDLVSTPSGTATLFWEMVTSVSGMGLPGYSYVAATTGDSVGAGNPRTLFMVQTRSGPGFWNSPPDSGYSVDNIPPVTPAPFAANRAAGTTFLHWSPNPESDLAGYRLYRGASPSFTPGPATLLASPPDTGYADAASATWTYKLTALDVHGNESPVATLTPSGIAGVGDAPVVRELALAPAMPNPAARGTTLRLALPVSTHVSLGIYDAAGRLVRPLAAGTLPAGEHAIAWDLRDTGGRIVGAGLYFARLEAGGRTLARRIAVTP